MRNGCGMMGLDSDAMGAAWAASSPTHGGRAGWSSTLGLHALGWSRQHAVDWLAGHAALGLEVEAEIDR